jgi:hypothetical protein
MSLERVGVKYLIEGIKRLEYSINEDFYDKPNHTHYAEQIPALWQFGPVTVADHRRHNSMTEIAF